MYNMWSKTSCWVVGGIFPFVTLKKLIEATTSTPSLMWYINIHTFHP